MHQPSSNHQNIIIIIITITIIIIIITIIIIIITIIIIINIILQKILFPLTCSFWICPQSIPGTYDITEDDINIYIFRDTTVYHTNVSLYIALKQDKQTGTISAAVMAIPVQFNLSNSINVTKQINWLGV